MWWCIIMPRVVVPKIRPFSANSFTLMNILMWNLAQMSLTVLPTYGKKNSVSKIPGNLNLKFTFQFDHSSINWTKILKNLRTLMLFNCHSNINTFFTSSIIICTNCTLCLAFFPTFRLHFSGFFDLFLPTSGFVS